MKFVRFTENKGSHIHSGVLENSNSIKEIRGDLFDSWEYTGAVYNVNDVRMEAPLVPNSIIGIGKNYLAPDEVRPEKLPDIPVLFYKPVTTLISTEDKIILPPTVDEVKFESELAVVIGKEAKNISEAEVFDYIFGYTVGNDVTAFSLFHPDGHWTLGKAADTFTPLGPVLETELDLSQIKIKSRLNGEEKQNSGLDKIIVGIPEMISYISKFVTLLPGDVILTGAPAGAIFMKDGDVIECIIDGIGTLRNTVSKA
jgi:2-keto-4-pentenoate hydratase/2-oxohepta-3-ene-1,7-dioic acid hydratase in catechol pathway